MLVTVTKAQLGQLCMGRRGRCSLLEENMAHRKQLLRFTDGLRSSGTEIHQA